MSHRCCLCVLRSQATIQQISSLEAADADATFPGCDDSNTGGPSRGAIGCVLSTVGLHGLVVSRSGVA